MKKFKKAMALGLTSLVFAGLSVPTFAAETKAVDSVNYTTQGSIVLSGVNLIEDNGQAYIEIIIPENQGLKAGGSYDTTYNMTGGVFTQQSWQCSNAPTFRVSVYPESFAGPEDMSDSKMDIYLERQSGIGWRVDDSDKTSLTKSGSVTLYGDQSGKYRLYFKNPTGFRATGDIYITYSY